MNSINNTHKIIARKGFNNRFLIKSCILSNEQDIHYTNHGIFISFQY